MELNLANIVTLLVIDRVISLGFIYLLVARIIGGKPLFQRRPLGSEDAE